MMYKQKVPKKICEFSYLTRFYCKAESLQLSWEFDELKNIMPLFLIPTLDIGRFIVTMLQMCKCVRYLKTGESVRHLEIYWQIPMAIYQINMFATVI